MPTTKLVAFGPFRFFEAERLLEEVEEEILKHEPVLAPEYCLAHGHDPIAVINPRNYRFAVSLLLLADIFCCPVCAKQLLRVQG